MLKLAAISLRAGSILQKVEAGLIIFFFDLRRGIFAGRDKRRINGGHADARFGKRATEAIVTVLT